MNIEKAVAEHYGSRETAESILTRARGKAPDPGSLSPDDLAPYDDMHIGGRKASEHLIARLHLNPGMRILDIGSGIGGPARFCADAYGVHVTGLDLTPEYRDTAQELSRATGLAERTDFVTGSALAMPFGGESFDAAYMIHAGMNIADKETLYREVFRVLKPGAVFGIYDIMGTDDPRAFKFPAPWSPGKETSFLEAPERIAALLSSAGFDAILPESRRDFALAALEKLLAHDSFGEKAASQQNAIRNLLGNIESGLCAPWEIVGWKKPA